MNRRAELRQTAETIARTYRHELTVAPRLRGTEAQQRAGALDRARERVTGRSRHEDPQMRLDLR